MSLDLPEYLVLEVGVRPQGNLLKREDFRLHLLYVEDVGGLLLTRHYDWNVQDLQHELFVL